MRRDATPPSFSSLPRPDERPQDIGPGVGRLAEPPANAGAQSSPGAGFLSRLGVREVRICRDAVKERYPGIGSTPG